jgi:hypothetical protein
MVGKAGAAVSDILSATDLRDAVSFAEKDIQQTLAMLVGRLPDGIELERCDVDVSKDRTFSGSVHYRFEVKILIEVGSYPRR